MKKLITAVVFAFLLAVGVHAAVGDIAGVYYSTDIVTTLNGYEISSVNIGGETLISAEDMRYYGFSVDWDERARLLMIRNDPEAEITGTYVRKYDGSVGRALGNYYETDIVTFFDGLEDYVAYNMGGRTYIHAEKMREYGYDVIWHPDERLLEINTPESIENWTLKLMKSEAKDVDAEGRFRVRYTEDGIEYEGDRDYFNLSFGCGQFGYYLSFVFYQNQGTGFQGEYQPILGDLRYKTVYDFIKLCERSDKYEEVLEYVTITVNGQKSGQMAVSDGAGNGHHDYHIYICDLPEYELDEIEEIIIEFNTEGLS